MQLLPDRLQVGCHRGDAVRTSVEVAEQLGSGGFSLDEVVEVEAELLRELLHRDVAVVDQLAAVLEDLPVGEDSAARETAPAEARETPRRSLR